MSRAIEVPLSLIDPNTTNPRKAFLHIKELADAIEVVGLLQNLVVKEKPGGRYEVKAGDRRRLALLRLVAEKRLPPDPNVRCFVISGSGDIETVVENVQRDALPPWEDGDSFNRLVEQRGMTHDEIGKAIGKSRSHVSMCIRIHRGLSEKLIPVLFRIGAAGPNVLQLLEVSKMVDKDTLGPDHEKQMKWLQSFVTRGVKKDGKKRYKTRRYYQDRLRILERMDFPKEVDDVVQAIVRYLNGEEMTLPGSVREAN